MHGVETRGLGIKRDAACLARPARPIVKLSACRHSFVIAAIDHNGADQSGASRNRRRGRRGLGCSCLQRVDALCIRL